MKALILCDGSEGSLRGIEVACASPSAAATSTSPDASLVLLHVWDRPAKSNPAGPPGEGQASHPAPGPSRMTSTTQATSEAATASPSASSPGQLPAAGGAHSTNMPCPDVLTATLKAIHTNKYIKGRAHYCVEAVCAAAVDISSSDVHTHVSLSSASASPMAEQERSGATSWRPSQTASTAPPAVAAEDPHHHGSSRLTNPVVCQAALCAAEHRVDAVLLGVGQRQEGKVCQVGTTAAGVLQHLHRSYPLYYIKKDGVKWRPAPAVSAATATTTAAAAAAAASPLRFTIVVPIQSSLAHAAPTAVEKSRAAADGGCVPTTVKASVEAVVRYVQQRCARPTATAAAATATPAPVTVDSLAFLLIVPSSLTHDDDADDDTKRVPAAPADGDAVSVVDVYKHYLESLLPSTMAASSAIRTASDQEDEAGVLPMPEEGADKSSGGDGTTTATPSCVSVCALKASKKHPCVTLDTADIALPQILKYVNAMKPDALVMAASLVPAALQLAMLSASKPHCIVLPC
jgi:hypothetical protein